ncbi:outer membrane beta-barrel protein [Formosa sp. S-31]|uniref:outer membrane beta-barrel protein n=1 Tax=Formosa sp. S-31 TaxID=2790949 RepID=UPI003EBCAD30
MSDKKHIDRLFQETLKDFDQKPDPAVWQAIEAELQKKRKQDRGIPIWWKLSGAAALLVLSLTLGYQFFKSNTKNNPIPKVVIDNNYIETPEIKDAVVNAETDRSTKTIENTKNATDVLDTSRPSTTSKPSKNTKTKSFSNSDTSTKNEATIGTLTKQSNDTATKETPQSFQLATTHTVPEKELPKASETKQSKSKDTLTIEDAIAEAKITPEAENKTSKWNVSTSIAPVYYNTSGTGSHLDNQFANNSKSGEINASYGVSVGYAVNNKLKIRSGINNLNLSFNTNDVIIYENASTAYNSAPQLQHVNTKGQQNNMAMLSAKTMNSANQLSVLHSGKNASINQQISYFEVPLEIEYRLINKKFGLQFIGGFSTFLLNDNQVFSEYNNTKTFIGEANNINNVSFSTNLGIGIDYNFSRHFNINLEPTFKYQLNAFNETSGTLKPYLIGIYTGLSYKF